MADQTDNTTPAVDEDPRWVLTDKGEAYIRDRGVTANPAPSLPEVE